MNVYDFDHTIYDGDSTLDFYKYCLKRKPIIIFYLFIQILGFLKYKLKLWDKHQFKQCFYGFLKYLDDPNQYVEDFWKIHKKKIKGWYFSQKEDTDVIISASPEFLLENICQEINVYLIASKVDIKTGTLLGENCYGEEKVRRFKERFPNSTINQFYSDSFSDRPLADLAKESYLVKKDKVIPHSFQNEKKESLFINKDFLKFVIIGVINTFNGVLFSSIAFYITKYSFLSFLFGYIVSLLIAYLLNLFFIFKSSLSFKKLIKFCISYLPNFFIQTVVVSSLLVITNIPETIIYLLSAIVSVPITFLLVKFYAMK